MKLIRTIAELQKELTRYANSGKIGFVPTMGALHQGHISLVKESLKNNDATVVSIFVNPTQFNDKNDFEKYPRDVEKDALLLEAVGVDYIFAPSEKEMYPEIDTRQFDFDTLDKVMEGEHRPGHFNGVAQIVSRLFDIVKPTKAYFGEKDFQQLAIIRAMVKQLNLPVQIVGMPIVRESSGLAMSSRNERLNKDQQENAILISKVLANSQKQWSKNSIAELTEKVIATINKNEYLTVEYFQIVDGYTLQPVTKWHDTKYAVGCIAVFCGDIRLIDNITYFNGLQLTPDIV